MKTHDAEVEHKRRVRYCEPKGDAMIATKSNNTLEICIRVDRDTLGVDAAKAAGRLAQVIRRRYGAAVISTAVIYPRVSDSVVISGGGVFGPMD